MSESSERKIAVVTTPQGIPIDVDLQEFFDGGFGAERTGTWTGDFSGRPNLASEFRDYLEREPLGKDSLQKRLTAARNILRFLDSSLDLPPVNSMADLNEIHGLRVKRWISAKGITSPHTYQDIKTIVQGCRDMLGLAPLVWPARDPDPNPDVPEPDYVGIQRLMIALKHEARAIKMMFREGHELASRGQDPRVGTNRLSAWSRRENHAWLIRELTAPTLPLKDELTGLHATGLVHAVGTDGNPVSGPEYLAPCMTVRGSEGYVGKLRWFYPALYDTAVFIWLVMLHTGWNLATVLGINISDRAEWIEEHPHQTDFMVLHAWKGRAKRHQFDICRAKPEYHPPQIIEFMIAKTVRMRDTLKVRMRRLEEENRTTPSRTLARKINELQDAIKSPWLFHSLGKGGDIGWFTSGSSSLLNQFIRTVADTHSLLQDHPYLATLSTSQARDAWINYAYASTGQSLVAQHSAGHRNQRSLRNYLARRRYRRVSEKKFRTFQDHVFSEISARRLDPTRLRILVEKGEITPEQEAALLDPSRRTRRNIRCLDPLNPPKELAPDHVAGEVCKVQRCTGCFHGIAFDDALEPLASALADLHAERRVRPLEAWSGTSLEEEEKSIAATLKQFDPQEVRAAYMARVAALKSGKAERFDAYPIY